MQRSEKLILTIGTTMRLTRLITQDDLGEAVRRPAERWAGKGRGVRGRNRRDRLVAGLSCPFCVGFWIGAGVLAAAPWWVNNPHAVLVARALTLNEGVGRAAAAK